MVQTKGNQQAVEETEEKAANRTRGRDHITERADVILDQRPDITGDHTQD